MFAACASTSEGGESSEEAGGIRIGSFDFDESALVAELYAQVLEHNEFEVVRLGQLGPREVVAPAIEQGLVDVVPEYLGTVTEYFRSADGGNPAAEVLSVKGLVLLEPARAENVNVFVVTTELADRLELVQVSDLVPHAAELTMGGPVECPDRPLCLAGLRSTYGIEFAQFVPVRSLSMTVVTLELGEIDVGLLFSTSAELSDGSLVVLADDRGLQPAENVVPLVRRDAVDRWGPDLGRSLDEMSARLTTTELQELNRRVDAGESLTRVATAWLMMEGLTSG